MIENEPLPSVEITEGNMFIGYKTRAATPEDLNLVLIDGKWLDAQKEWKDSEFYKS